MAKKATPEPTQDLRSRIVKAIDQVISTSGSSALLNEGSYTRTDQSGTYTRSDASLGGKTKVAAVSSANVTKAKR